MPIHDWTRVDAGLFHAFHHDWITTLTRALNAGISLPTTSLCLNNGSGARSPTC